MFINAKVFKEEILRIYDEHYAHSPDQTVHDIFNAVFKRIRRYEQIAYPEVEKVVFTRIPNTSEWVADVYVCILDRKYDIFIRIPSNVNGFLTSRVEVFK